MTIKEKAEELFYKYNTITSKEFKSDTFTSANSAKKCALIAVDEIIKICFTYNEWYWDFEVNQDDEYTKEYWLEVKQEIEKL